jgi:glutamine amidotransferase-like uncharacterized protein
LSRVLTFVLIVVAFAACARPLPSGDAVPILLFTGDGTSSGDVAAIEEILKRAGLSYAPATSAQLNWLPEAELRKFRLLIVPGGNFIHIGRGLMPSATANIRHAIAHGVNYLGICAGAFLAGDTGYNSVNLSGVRFPFYSAESHGIHRAAVRVAAAGGPTLDQYWEDGPQLTGWGAVVARYPDETPAITEGTYGSGFVLLSGIHPEAPADWRRGMGFATPAATDQSYALQLIRAALNGAPEPHY